MRDNNVNDQIISNNAMIEMEAISENESFARVVVASFVTSLDPTLEEISDIKTAVSEAVTNCIIHGYDHRINLTLYKLDKIMNGDIQEIIDACIAADQAKKLAKMGEE